MIRKLQFSDADRVLEIYQQGLDTGAASFEIEAPDWETWERKYLSHSRLAWEQQGQLQGQLQGWAALAAVSSRYCYRGVAEVSIYVATAAAHQGIGTHLMAALVSQSEENGIWSLYSSIFPENQATLKMHLRQGFRQVGIRERIAQQHGRWRDTLILERRSASVGV
jgi:L-amino acid N-acyltransferase YncA